MSQVDRFLCPTTLNLLSASVVRCGERVSLPISSGGATDLRRLILRTLNDNQILVLNSISQERQSLTSLLKHLSEEYCIPLSTLKLNARILRELNLITYGSVHNKRNAKLKPLGRFVMNLMTQAQTEEIMLYAD